MSLFKCSSSRTLKALGRLSVATFCYILGAAELVLSKDIIGNTTVQVVTA